MDEGTNHGPRLGEAEERLQQLGRKEERGRRERAAAGAERAHPVEGDRHRRRTSRVRIRLILLVLFVVVAVAVVGGLGFYKWYFHTGKLGAKVQVTIPAGVSLHTIAEILQQKGVVPRARAFEIRAAGDGHGTDLKAGTYVLRQNEPYDQLVATLTAGGEQAAIKVTIPEGYTIAQTAALLAKTVPGFSAQTYLDLAVKHPVAAKVSGYSPGRRLEGLLFPATYDVLSSVTPHQFIERQLTAYRNALAGIDLSRARKANLTPYDVTIIASMVEREVEVPSERPLVAAVIWNRLRQGMRLQIDATVEYVLPEHKPVLTYDDLKTQSPYNTYLHAGLPPTPIANPGVAALKAAADPADVDYLYYVARDDGSGQHYFSSTYSQFLSDKQKAAAVVSPRVGGFPLTPWS